MEKFKFDQKISEEIFFTKYAINGEKSVEEILKQVAKKVASSEKRKNKLKWEYEFYDAMIKGKFIPAGRILSNARDKTTIHNFSNCFVIDVEDDLEKIYDSIKEGALISKQGGGFGFNISKVRPKNDGLSIGGTASGPISFMKVFDQSAKIIMTGGARRSAIISILNVDHPDIESFITCKQGDENKELTQMNISVGITDKFINAVEYDLDWDLQFNDKVYKTVKATYLYDLLCKNAFTHNEPGILNLDTLNRSNNGFYMEDFVATNPCFSGDMKLLTNEGYKTFASLEGKNIQIINNLGEVSNSKIWCSGEKETVILNNSLNEKIECTPNHKFMLMDGTECEAKNLKGKKIKPFIKPTDHIQDSLYIQLGFIQGDGQTGRLKSESHKGLEVNIGKKDKEIWSLFGLTESNKRRVYLNGFNEICKNLGFSDKPLPESCLPKKIESFTNVELRSFIVGLYSANGSIIKNKRVSFKSTCYNLISQLKEILKNNYNIESFITTNKTSIKKFSNGDYLCKESYDLNICKYNSIKTFYKEFKFLQEYKNKSLHSLVIKRTPTIKSIKKGTIKKVYDFNEPKTHWGVVNGYIAHNCGELPLFKYEACNLGSINLSKFVKNPFSDTCYFDCTSFRNTIKTGIRFLDNVVDITKMPLEKINKNVKNNRRIGLGFTGLGDTFAKMKYKYGSDKSKNLSCLIALMLRDTSYLASSLLAKEKGKFKNYKKDILESNFIKGLPNNLQQIIKKYGLRNISVNTTAPTGTTSFTLGQNCSSGIEPMFSLEYDRTIRIGNSEETKSQKVYDCAWLDYQKITDIETVPDYFNLAKDIEPKDSIEIQAIFQKYIDGSISKTLNLPLDITYEKYKELFLYAYKKGLKGFTTFNPNGSMKGILDYSNKKDNEDITIERHDAPKRPKDLKCEIYSRKVGNDNFTILVGLLKDGSIYEVFVDDNHIDVQKYKEGIIRKMGKSKYNLIVEEEIVIENISKAFNKTYGTLTRLVSANLRHGMPLECLVDILSKSDEFISFDKALARVLKTYIKNGEKVNLSKKCGECGSTNLVYIEGCITCQDCNYAKCG